jgi:hypothetical protein
MAEANVAKGNSKSKTAAKHPLNKMMDEVFAGAKKVIAKSKPDSATAKAEAAEAAPAKKAAKLKPGVPSTPAAIAAAKKAAAKDKPADVSVGTPKDMKPAKGAAKKAPIVTETPKKAAKAAPKVASAKALEKLKVAEPDKARKGETADYVAAAKRFKNGFTRDQLHETMVKAGKEDKAARIKIADCVYFEVFVPA